jgi:hypothetical protein
MGEVESYSKSEAYDKSAVADEEEGQIEDGNEKDGTRSIDERTSAKGFKQPKPLPNSPLSKVFQVIKFYLSAFSKS